MGRRTKVNFQKWDLNDEDGREVIQDWSRVRHERMQGIRKKYYKKFLVHTFNFHTCRSFIANFNFMVILQMIIAALSVYVFDYFDISFDFHVSLFVSPIVFPLAFSINTDFQRREKVLEDLANFKSSSMLWFFCMREWKVAAQLEDAWLDSVHSKVKNMMFNLREYLLTDKIDRRCYIARCLYEDFSDANQLIERVRASNLPSNTAIISRVIHLLNMLCLSFERLRVIREYRSPRSIRSFNKVLILFLPIILSPYFVYMSRKEGTNAWSPYYIAILVAAVFGALQGVQDKLDNPFDGMSEDDIHLQTIDDWTFNNLEVVKNRNFTVGRFHVSANIDDTREKTNGTDKIDHLPVQIPDNGGLFGTKIFKKNSRRKRKGSIHRTTSSSAKHPQFEEHHPNFNPESHPYADVLQNIKGSSRVQAVKKTGKVLVTDTITRFDGNKSSSSIESDSPEGNRLLSIFRTKYFSNETDVDGLQRKEEQTNFEKDKKGARKVDAKMTFEVKEPKERKEVKFSLSPVSSDDSMNEERRTLESPTKKPLIQEKKQTSSRFKLNCIPSPKTFDVIENNNRADEASSSDVSPRENKGDKSDHSELAQLREIVIENIDVNKPSFRRQEEFQV